MLTHLAADRGKDFVPVCKFHTEHGVGQRFDYCSFEFECSVFLRQFTLDP